MRIRVIYLGVVRQKTGRGEEDYDLVDKSSLKDLLVKVAEKYPSLRDIIGSLGESLADPTLIAALNGASIKIAESDSIMLKDGDTITLMTVIGGG
ncbi:MAG: MoaD/ThiS family protein [Candidatus Bathyarchaeia archaeon]